MRLGEADKLAKSPATETVNEPRLKNIHRNGPLPEGRQFGACDQYAEVVVGSTGQDTVISITEGNDCVKVNDNVVKVRNILDTGDDILIVYSVYNKDEAFYTYPLDSRVLDIHKVSDLGGLDTCPLASLTTKYVLLALSNKEVALPLIHTM